MTLLKPVGEHWKKHLFNICEDLNDEELTLARQLDNHPKVEWWLRNVVQSMDGFRLQGFQRHGFYPDFIVRLMDGRWIVIEYKGADRASNDDSDYKKNLGKIWASVCKKEYAFALVEKESIASLLSSL